jgi:hypothetical protein
VRDENIRNGMYLEAWKRWQNEEIIEDIAKWNNHPDRKANQATPELKKKEEASLVQFRRYLAARNKIVGEMKTLDAEELAKIKAHLKTVKS